MHLCYSQNLLDGLDIDDGGVSLRVALGQAAWLQLFWLPVQQRKNPTYTLTIEEGTVFSCHRQDDLVPTVGDAMNDEASSSAMPDWKKLLQSALKKIQVEDLGDLSAPELLASVPEHDDKEGRGRQDLERLERQLSVKVLFLDQVHGNRILLVGSKPKLEKKCLAIRNMLSHYYWRLKGKQVFL